MFEESKAVDIYLDIQKAFIKVPRRRVDNGGLDYDELRWLFNWLSGRKQRMLLVTSSGSRLDRRYK